MAFTVTATQGSGTNGIGLRVEVLTSTAAVQNGQTGGNSGNPIADDVAITPVYSNSRIYVTVYASGTGVLNSPTGATTVIDNVGDVTNNSTYATAKGNALTTAGTPQTIGWTDTNGSSVTGMEIAATSGLGPVEDASGPAPVSNTGGASVTTASFTPPNGALLMALVDSKGSGTMTVTDTSGLGLTWTEQVKQNGFGYSGIWTAQIPSAVSHPVGTVPVLMVNRTEIVSRVTGRVVRR